MTASDVREGRDTDAEAFIALVSGCWAEYPGCIFDLDGEVPELRALATYFAASGGALWVAEWDGRVVGMIGASPRQGGVWEVQKLYVAPARRGDGTAAALLATAEARARAGGATRLTLWTDTRFERAHRFYEKHGYVRRGPIRALDDRSHTIEFGYAKPIEGVECLDAAAADSAIGALTEILIDSVADGASVSFLPPLAGDVARAFWRKVARGVATGEAVLFAGWVDGRLAGTVNLDLDTPPNQPHRAELRKLLVASWARRRGLARALLSHAEAAALDRGRTLLTLDTRVGDAAEFLYRDRGWVEAGRIPGFSLDATGEARDTAILYRHLAR